MRTAALCALSAVVGAALAATIVMWQYQRGLEAVQVIAEDNQASVWARQLTWSLDTAQLPEAPKAGGLAIAFDQSIKGTFLVLEKFAKCHSAEVCARVEEAAARARSYAKIRGLSLVAE